MTDITRAEIEAIAERAGEKGGEKGGEIAMRKLMLAFGVDVDEGSDMRALNEDLIFARMLREGAAKRSAVFRQVKYTLLSMTLLAVAGWFFTHIQAILAWLGSKFGG